MRENPPVRLDDFSNLCFQKFAYLANKYIYIYVYDYMPYIYIYDLSEKLDSMAKSPSSVLPKRTEQALGPRQIVKLGSG